MEPPKPSPKSPMSSTVACRFVSQFDGVSRCSEPAHDLGFCRFHRDALDRGEIDEDGVMSDSCIDQRRRRAITYHGMTSLPTNPDLQ